MDAWSEAIAAGRTEQDTRTISRSLWGQIPEPEQICGVDRQILTELEERKNDMDATDAKLFTVIAVRNPSLLEQQQGVGTIILAGPTAVMAVTANTAAAQFGAANADKINKAPAGLLAVAVKEGM